jgi:uncharacterized protein
VEPPLPPAPGTYFTDNAHVVTPEAASYINQRLAAFERETSNQLVVAVYDTLPDGAELDDYVNRTYQAWSIGQKGRDNGVLLMVFVKDRKMRIEVGYGLEGALPDSIAASIIRDVIGPPFKSGAYGSGLQNGVEAIISATKNEYKALAAPASESQGSPLIWIIILLVIIFIIWSHTGDTMLQRAGREIFWAVLSSSSSGGSGSSSGGSSSSSGGFSGGGGRSGGGGASGSW